MRVCDPDVDRPAPWSLVAIVRAKDPPAYELRWTCSRENR